MASNLELSPISRSWGASCEPHAPFFVLIAAAAAGVVQREPGTRGDWDECGRDWVKMQGKTGKSDQSAACVKRKTDAAEVCIGASVHLPLNKRVCVSQ